MTTENENVVGTDVNTAGEHVTHEAAIGDMQAGLEDMTKACTTQEPSDEIPVESDQDQPVGVVISGGEVKPITEIPDAVKAQIEADAKAEADASEEQEPVEAPKLDENDPLNETSTQQLGVLMKQVGQMMGMFEAQWSSTKQEFKLSDSHMRQLYAYNREHATPMPEGLSPEESVKFDVFNGLDGITEEKVLEIFGTEHPIIGVEHTITLDRIKSVTKDFFSWMDAVREYQQIHDAYMELIEAEEDQEIKKYENLIAIEEDPEKKQKMQAALDVYYNRKYLEFIAEPLDEKKIDVLVKAWTDEKKIQYWLERSRVKLGQMRINAKFILEISQFEKRFLPEEFHGQNNIFLLYFLNLVVYCDVYNKSDADRNKVACIIFGMDKFIRNVWAPEIREKILANMIEFQKQFVGKLAAPTAVEEAPEVEEVAATKEVVEEVTENTAAE